MANHRDIIDDNFVKLCQSTQCNEILIDTCTERKIITREDKDLIEKEELPYKRNRIFYDIIRLKDETNFQKIIDIMKEESTAQSSDVLKILERNQPGTSSQTCVRAQNSVEPEEKSVWFNVQDPVTSFVGRENELKQLHQIVTRNADKDTQVAIMSQLSSVSGMGGIGKTTLAREYAKRYSYYFKNNIIWINAETITSTEDSFRKLADKIGIQNKMTDPISKVISDTYEYFSRRKCLFVFDNVDEYKSTVAPFIPKSYEPGKIRPYILMTSRKQRLVHDSGVLSLDILAMEDAEKFITSKLQECMGQIDEESVRKLAMELQCLPLALQQAVDYIRNQVRLKSFLPGKDSNPTKEYLKLLEENPKVPLNHEYQTETMDDYAYTVMRTWDLTLKAIEREEYGSQAIEILEMMSYFPPENVYINEFSSYSAEVLQQSCLILEQYSFINRVGVSINIHRLVQQVVRIQNKEKQLEEGILSRCLSLAVKNAACVDLDKDWMYWNIWKYTLRYENLVTKYFHILGKIFRFTNINDLEILNSSLEILEKSEEEFDLSDLYSLFIRSFLRHEIRYGDVPNRLGLKAMTRLNELIEFGHDSIFDIIRRVFSLVKFHSVTQLPKLVRDVMLAVSNYCYKHSSQIFPVDGDTPYNLIRIWLKSNELKQCRMCLKLLVLEAGAESVNNMAIVKLRHPVFEYFHLFNKYMLQLGIITEEAEREFVREVLDFCRSVQLEAVILDGWEKVDILLCNILCLVFLHYNFVHEILTCVFKISIEMRNKPLFYHYSRFRKMMKDITGTLNGVVIIGTTPLVSSEWAHYVDRIIRFVGTYDKMMDFKLDTDDSATISLLELESTFCELKDCCRWFVDISAVESSGSSGTELKA